MKAGTAGGIEAVVKAISTHINNSSVCCAECGTLLIITNNGKNTDIKPNTTKCNE